VKHIFPILIVLLLFSSGFVGVSNTIEKSSAVSFDGNTLYVGGSGPGNYSKIQDAIDNATDGDTVYVYNGTYYEKVVIDKSINLIGEDRDTTILRPENKNGSSGWLIVIFANDVKIKSFTITHGNLSGIEIYGSSNNITDNKITSNNYCGIELYGSSSNNITGNNILNNYRGIELYGSSNNITGNNITSNNNDGILLWDDSTSNTITDNKITSNNYSGIEIYGSSNTITGNNISNNNDGIRLRDNSTSNTITSNSISSNNGNGINIWYSSNNTILKNNFLGNKRHAFFKNCTNTWKQNYWNRPRILPKLIFGIIKIGSIWIPWFNIDWCPAKEPYDIGSHYADEPTNKQWLVL